MAGRKKGKLGFTTSQLFNFARDSYLERTSRPMYAIAFLLPFILFYEIGTILINTDVLSRTQVRVVAFVWVQEFLQYLGTGNKFAWVAPPLVVVVILLGLQIASQKQWCFCFSDYMPMVLECTLLAVPLIVLSLFFNSPVAGPQGGPRRLTRRQRWPAVHGVRGGADTGMVSHWHGIVAALETSRRRQPTNALAYDQHRDRGRGGDLRRAGLSADPDLRPDGAVSGRDRDSSRQNAIVLVGADVGGPVQRHHHHIIWMDGRLGRGAPFNWTEFVFRTIAGVYFAILFAIRGFGITAGTHAFYDILATLVNAIFFGQ